MKFQKKPWFKFLKIFYFAAITLILALLASFQFEKRPRIIKTIDAQKSLITCANAKIYEAKKIKISIWQDEFSKTDDQNARILCQYGEVDFSAHKSENIEKNYQFNLVQNRAQLGDWSEWNLKTTFALLLLLLVNFIIRSGFFYLANKGNSQRK